jgi:hypothetical protein
MEKTFPQVFKDFFSQNNGNSLQKIHLTNLILLFTILVGSNMMFFFRIGDVVEVAFIHKKL